MKNMFVLTDICHERSKCMGPSCLQLSCRLVHIDKAFSVHCTITFFYTEMLMRKFVMGDFF